MNRRTHGNGYAPSNRFALISFLIGGPMLYLPVFQAFQGDLLHAPIAALFGIFAWLIFLMTISGWFISWIPTTLSALTCAYALRYLAQQNWFASNRLFVRTSSAAVLCGIISGAIYLACFKISGVIHPPPAGYKPAPAMQYPLGIQLTSYKGGVLVVTCVGTLLGIWLAWRAGARNASRAGATA